MFVRAYDKIHDIYYKSIVYGELNTGYYKKAILLNPRADIFVLVEFTDKSAKPIEFMYEIIDRDRRDWVTFEKYKTYRKQFLGCDAEEMFFVGYLDVIEDSDFMEELLAHGAVPRKKAKFKIRSHRDADVWTYIETQKDADAFLEVFAGFHDSTIDKITYEESFEERKLSVIFDNHCWFGTAELCFECVIAMNLRPPNGNYSRELWEGCLWVNADGSVFFADRFLDMEDLNYDGTFIKALNLKWRKIEINGE